jgi:hypothetical protein
LRNYFSYNHDNYHADFYRNLLAVKWEKVLLLTTVGRKRVVMSASRGPLPWKQMALGIVWGAAPQQPAQCCNYAHEKVGAFIGWREYDYSKNRSKNWGSQFLWTVSYVLCEVNVKALHRVWSLKNNSNFHFFLKNLLLLKNNSIFRLTRSQNWCIIPP